MRPFRSRGPEQQAAGWGGTANRRTNEIDRRAYVTRRPIPGEVDYTIDVVNRYPIYLDAGEHFFRLRTGWDYFPYPPRVGIMNAFMPQQDVLVWSNMYRKAPVGPLMTFQQGMAGMPIPVANLQYQMAVPGLTKIA